MFEKESLSQLSAVAYEPSTLLADVPDSRLMLSSLCGKKQGEEVYAHARFLSSPLHTVSIRRPLARLKPFPQIIVFRPFVPFPFRGPLGSGFKV